MAPLPISEGMGWRRGSEKTRPAAARLNHRAVDPQDASRGHGGHLGQAVPFAQISALCMETQHPCGFPASRPTTPLRPGTDATQLEWLRPRPRAMAPQPWPKRSRRCALKELGATRGPCAAWRWPSSRPTHDRCSRDARPRRVRSARASVDRVACFLRVALLELTDVAQLQSSRCSQQLFRKAGDRAQANRIRGTTGLLKQAVRAKAVLHDEARSWQDRASCRPSISSPISANRPQAASCPR